MHRLFTWLAMLAVVFYAATLLLGFLVEPAGLADGHMALKRIHFLAGLATAVLVMFINGIVVTYFIGTSRWCKEVVDAYGFEPHAAANSAALKRGTFPLTLASMLLIVSVVSLGAAADPATQTPPPPVMAWPEIHMMWSLISLAIMAYVAFVQWANIRANQQVIQSLVERVREVRREKGLDEVHAAGAEDKP